MKNTRYFIYATLLVVGAVSTPGLHAGGAKNHTATVTGVDCPGDDSGTINAGLDCYSVQGWSQGNHELNCTIVLPQTSDQHNTVPLNSTA